MKCNDKKERKKKNWKGRKNKEAFKARECGGVVAIESNKVGGKAPN